MDSKEGIEKVVPAGAQAAGLLDPSLLWPDLDDTLMCPKDTPDNLPHKRAGCQLCWKDFVSENHIACMLECWYL